MRFQSLVSPLAFLSLGLPACCLSNTNDGSITLSPINIKDFENIVGIQRRAAEDFSDLDPALQARLIYGSPGDGGQLLLANMTLHASNGMNIVMMEKFEGLTKEVDCKGDDGLMSLTFNSEKTFDYALKSWDFINEAPDKRFLLIANHDGCGPDDERQPYIITNIREDKSTLTTFLTAQTAPWSDIADTFDLDFGKVVTDPASNRRLKTRGLLNKSFEKTKQMNVNLSVGKPGVRTNLVTAAEEKIKVDCVDCYVTGSFQVTGHLSVKGSKVQECTIEALPRDVAAKLGLEATLSASKELGSIDKTKTLFSFPILDASISVYKIFTLGATMSYEVGINSTFSGEGVVDFGVTASLPNSASVTADLWDKTKNSAVGFDKGDVKPFFDVKSLSASFEIDAYSKAQVSFGMSVVGIGDLEVAVALQVPKITTSLTAAYDPHGACSTDPGSSKTGVKVDSQIGLEVDLDFEAGLGDSGQPVKNVKIFDAAHPLLATCFPMDIPGLAPVLSTSKSASSLRAPSSSAPFPSNARMSPGSFNPLPTGSFNPLSTGSFIPIPTGSFIPIPTGSIHHATPGSASFHSPVPTSSAPSSRPSGSGAPVAPALVRRAGDRWPYRRVEG